MEQAVKNTIATLKERGYRITHARTAVVEALATQTRPHTIAEYVAHVQVDEATVYRTFELLLTEELVERIDVEGEARYALAHGHHHHIVCTGCGHTEHLPCSTPKPKLEKHSFASITDHAVTFYGLCKNCA